MPVPRMTALWRETARDFLIGIAIFAVVVVLAVLDTRAAHPSPLAGDAAPTVSLSREYVGERDYVLATLTPPPAERRADAPARDVILLVDSSGSMAGAPIGRARIILKIALAGLQPGDTFNIIRFADRPEPLFDAPVPVGDDSMTAAKAFIDSLPAAGSSQILPALAMALGDREPQSQRLRQVILLTDGIIAKQAEVYTETAAKRGRSRLFAVGLGTAADDFFMGRLAEIGRGEYLAIEPPDSTLNRAMGLLSRLKRPVVTDLRVQWAAGVRADAWPDPLPDLYAGKPVAIAAQLSSLKGDITLTGTLHGKPWRAALPLAHARADGGIGEIWARRKIATLHARRWLGQDARLIEAAVSQVAREHGLVHAVSAIGPASATPPGGGGEPAPPATETGHPLEAAGLAALLDQRVLLVAAMALFFAAMCAVTFGFWRHLSREYVSARRPRRGI